MTLTLNWFKSVRIEFSTNKYPIIVKKIVNLCCLRGKIQIGWTFRGWGTPLPETRPWNTRKVAGKIQPYDFCFTYTLKIPKLQKNQFWHKNPTRAFFGHMAAHAAFLFSQSVLCKYPVMNTRVKQNVLKLCSCWSTSRKKRMYSCSTRDQP